MGKKGRFLENGNARDKTNVEKMRSMLKIGGEVGECRGKNQVLV